MGRVNRMRYGILSLSLLLAVLFSKNPLLRAQTAEDQAPASEAAPGQPSSPPPSSVDERRQPDLLPQEQNDPIVLLGQLRRAVRLSPDRAEDRLTLAEALYRIGDLESAAEETRAAIRLNAQDARAHLHLGVVLMAKQDWHAAQAALTEAVALDPSLTLAYYNLGGVHYSLGHVKPAIQAYRRALELQSDFSDARYRLALLLKLTGQPREAVRFMEEAALGGVAQAQYFMGQAYRNGQGVEKDWVQAIQWWSTAMESGQPQATEALSQLRRQALSTDPSARRRKEALEAFTRYREDLWKDYPDLARNGHDSLGLALIAENRATNGLTALFAEAYALSEPAHEALARFYETGLDSRLAQHDPRILRYVETMAADGFVPARKTLAHLYAGGLGVARDIGKAKGLLKGLPKQDVTAILDEAAAP